MDLFLRIILMLPMMPLFTLLVSLTSGQPVAL
jgi:hypothetical protein